MLETLVSLNHQPPFVIINCRVNGVQVDPVTIVENRPYGSSSCAGTLG